MVWSSHMEGFILILKAYKRNTRSPVPPQIFSGLHLNYVGPRQLAHNYNPNTQLITWSQRIPTSAA